MKIKEEFKALIPDLSKEEYKQLESNCLEEGIREKILTWNGFIIDGHNRYAIATQWNLEYQTEAKHFNSEDDVKIWMATNQLGRRNLSDFVKGELMSLIEVLLKEKGKEEMIRKPISALSTIDKPKVEHNTQKIVSEKLGWSTGKKAMFDVVTKKAPEEIKEQLRSGDVSINKVYQDIKSEEKNEKRLKKKQEVIESRVDVEIPSNMVNGDSLEVLETLADKSIDILLTDPPYGINYKSNRSKFDDTITKQGLMNDGKDEAFELLDDTCKILDRKMSNDSHLYFFCSWSVFSDFQRIIGKYFTIKTPIIWDKGNKGSGDLENDWGNQTEIIIYCVKGKKYINKRRGNIISVPRLSTVNMIHPTQKPEELINQILEVSAVEGDFIVDPFMGSGSTIKACNKLGFKSLGIELDNEVFKAAV